MTFFFYHYARACCYYSPFLFVLGTALLHALSPFLLFAFLLFSLLFFFFLFFSFFFFCDSVYYSNLSFFSLVWSKINIKHTVKKSISRVTLPIR
ncbi:hypothetical protein QBC38DRAFT_149161 [Podospora fimiseda]|uniref:Uncharacterized protein n=1 Tax=Podospora fimiseda TaxID=252190 RepID=A0AAN6YNM2_9PEZI|nr:hypothetical protein QBC38DRAFT_149161 [Podospora fimiseda]